MIPFRSRQQAAATVPAARSGFTMLELLIVCALIAIMLVVSVPGFRAALFTDPLKRSARQVIGLINEARQLAAVSEQGCFLDIDIEAGSLALSCPADAATDDGEVPLVEQPDEREPARVVQLTDQVRLMSVWNGAGEETATGTVSLWINQRGMMEPAIINLSDGSDEIGLAAAPFLTEIRLADEALVPETDEGWGR